MLQSGDLRHRITVVQKLTDAVRAAAAFGTEATASAQDIWARVQAAPRRSGAQNETDGVVSSESDYDVVFRGEHVDLVRNAEHLDTPDDGRLLVREVTRVTRDGRFWRAGCRNVV